MASRINNALILAAGFGTRLRPVTGNIPKPLVQIGGLSALEISLNSLNELSNIQRIFINIHWQAGQIMQFIHAKLPEELLNKTDLLHEEVLLETGGGILNAIHKAGNKSLLIKNSDVIFLTPNGMNIYQILFDAWDETQMDALLLLTDQHNGMGDFSLTGDGKITMTSDSNHYTYTGCSIISPALFRNHKRIEPFPLSKILFDENNYTQGRIRGLILPQDIKWFDIGTPSSLEETRLAISDSTATILQ